MPPCWDYTQGFYNFYASYCASLIFFLLSLLSMDYPAWQAPGWFGRSAWMFFSYLCDNIPLICTLYIHKPNGV
jgi:hypothetical protein